MELWPTNVAGWIGLVLAVVALLGVFWRGGKLEGRITTALSELTGRQTTTETKIGALEARATNAEKDRAVMNKDLGGVIGAVRQVVERMERREEASTAAMVATADRLARIEERLNIADRLTTGLGDVVKEMKTRTEVDRIMHRERP